MALVTMPVHPLPRRARHAPGAARAALLLAGLAACATPAPVPAPTPAPVTVPAPAAPPAIGAEELRRDLAVFAADSFRGRETGTPDAERAAAFLAARLAALNLEPAGDSGFFQRVPLRRIRLADATRFSVTSDGRTTTLPLGDAVLPLLDLGDDVPKPKHHGSGEMVFVGYGITDPTLGRNDLAGRSLTNKVVVVVHGAPAGVDSARRAQLEAPAELSARLGRILPAGPAAIVVVTIGAAPEALYAQYGAEVLSRMTLASTVRPASDAERLLPMIVLARATPGSPLLPARWPADTRAQALSGRVFRGDVAEREEPFVAHNVVGIVRGRDPRLNQSYVAYGAHLDHIGVVAPVHATAAQSVDSIANGADDDGSGSVSLLALARAFAQAPPRRSILFVWHTGEEKGLFGSEHFTQRPTVPIDSIVAQVNMDMVGRNHPDSLYVVGPMAAPNEQSRQLGRVVDSVNAAQPRPFRFDRTWDDPEHPERIYYRSDHYNYARKGVPIVFLTTGLHEDYHKPSDEVSKIDFEKMARVNALLLELGRALGDRPQRPR